MRKIFMLACMAFFYAWAMPAAATEAAHEGEPAYGLSVFGKLKYPENFKHFDYVNPDAPKGGDVRMFDAGSFDNLNPFIVKGNKAPAITMLFESLMVPSYDEPESMYGLIAKSAILAPDRSHIDFIMRPEARFQDGSSITADDVVFSFNTLKEKGDPTYRITYDSIASVVKLDEHKVRFNFSDTTKRELPLIAAGMPILSKAYYSTHDFTQTTLTPPLGSGPYRVKSVDQGRSITYERVKNYWGAKLPVNVGQYNFNTITVTMYRDETVALEAFKAGAYDYRLENIARVWATGYDCPALRAGKIKKIEFPNQVPQGMQGFAFNIRRDKFSDWRVRKAIGQTLDFQWMNKSLFFSAYKRDDSFFLNTQYAAKGLPSDAEKKLLEPYKDELPPGILSEPFTLPVTDGSGNNRAQLIEADKLLNEAGWIIKNGKRVNAKTGEPLTFEFLLNSPTFERVVAPMREGLARLGINATIRVADAAQFEKRLETFDYDVIVMVFNRNVFFPGNEQMAYWHSSQSKVEGSNNVIGTNSKVIDMLLSKITSAKTEEELIPPARALDRVLLWENYVIPNWYLGAYRMAYWDKFSQPAVKPKYSPGFPFTWWMK
ncbi:MAG TPA: extracellular solute-binding protein [Rickettsiales bacterium]|nr:extracellular solute-binding protein [Rickettsiales bacterium]